jgi:hypothetical protein
VVQHSKAAAFGNSVLSEEDMFLLLFGDALVLGNLFAIGRLRYRLYVIRINVLTQYNRVEPHFDMLM